MENTGNFFKQGYECKQHIQKKNKNEAETMYCSENVFSLQVRSYTCQFYHFGQQTDTLIANLSPSAKAIIYITTHKAIPTYYGH